MLRTNVTWLTSPTATPTSAASRCRCAPSPPTSARPPTSTRRRPCWRATGATTTPSPRSRTSSATRSRPTGISACWARSRAPAPAAQVYGEAATLKGVEVVGADSHCGSQLTRGAPLADAVARIAALVKTLRERSIEIRMVDVGGGMGARDRDEGPPTHREYARVLLPALRELGVTVLLEPGRSIVGNAGILLTRVLYRKETGEKTFVVVDAAMNDLIRPALYDAYHELQPVAEARLDAPLETVDVVGPICESGDFLAQDRALARTEEGDLLAIMSAGAYASAMASNYNTRPRAVEVLVDGNRYTIVRRRETYEDLVAGETVL